MAPRRAGGRVRGQRGEHRVAARLQLTANALEIRLEVTACDELGHDGLREERRGDVRRDRALLEGRSVGSREHEVAGSHARSDRLREGRGVGDQLPAFELEEARRGCSFEAYEAVRVILEDCQPVLADDLDQPRAPLSARASARSGSGTSGSCRGRTVDRHGHAARPREHLDRDLRRPSRGRRSRLLRERGS